MSYFPRLPLRRVAIAGAVVAAAVVAAANPAVAQETADVATTLTRGPSPLTTAVALSALALVPFALVIMTSFAKIAVVLSILRSALGTQQVPPNLVITALAIALSAYVMAPVFGQMTQAAEPLLEAERAELQELDRVREAVAEIVEPWRAFLAANSGRAEIELFAGLRGQEPPESIDDVPLGLAIPAFAITELAEAFQIGFLLFLPFLVLDLLVGSVLLSLGMHMLSPTSVSLPFKLLLFVLVNGWIVLSESLVLGYLHPGAVP